MDYLTVTFAWYLLGAFLVGALVGWITCGRSAKRR
mgnify:CR=1 FL=1|jgi:hypothetical protein